MESRPSMGDPDPHVVANLRKRRGVAKASVTCLNTRVANLEGDPHMPNIAKQQLTRPPDASPYGPGICS